jgi:hypothetical protein
VDLFFFFLLFFLFFFVSFGFFDRFSFFEFLVSMNTLQFYLFTDVLKVRLTIEQL